jgi:hypothetical protein
MRACDIDRSGDVWVYEPHDHKNRWRGHRRLIPLGPKAQEIIQQHLQLDTHAYLFSPAESESRRNGERRQKRKGPVSDLVSASRERIAFTALFLKWRLTHGCFPTIAG